VGAAAAGFAAMAGFSWVRAWSSRICGGAAGGLTTTVPGGGATTTTGRVGAAAPAGALATTGATGGREAMAGIEGGAEIMGGAERGWGTILRGSGRAGGAGGGVTAAGALATTGWESCAVTAFAWTGRDPAYSSFFLARMAFITSPGLEICERSILGAMACAPRPDAPAAC
jgi:hypothetical protein